MFSFWGRGSGRNCFLGGCPGWSEGLRGGGGPGAIERIRQKQSFRKDTTAVKKTYHIVNREEETAVASLEQFAKSNGQLLLPLIELITEARIAVDEVISSVGRKTIETILMLSAEQIAGAQS